MTDNKETLFTLEFKLGKQGEVVVERFHIHDNFMKLPMDIQHELINKVMTELGEQPTPRVGGYISCN